MSKLGKKLLAAFDEGIAIVRGEADPATFEMAVEDDEGGLRYLTLDEKIAHQQATKTARLARN